MAQVVAIDKGRWPRAWMLTFLVGSAVADPQVGLPKKSPIVNLPEYVAKAGFIFNFAKYVEWPASAFERSDSPISVGIVGTDPFGDSLEKTIKSKTVNGRTFAIQHFRAPADIRRCHMLYIPRAENPHLPEILKKIAGWPVLTVGESDGFCRAGGIVNILIQNEMPRLQVNPNEAKKSNLTINSKLIKISEVTETDASR